MSSIPAPQERLESVAKYTDALEAVKELKGLEELKQSVRSWQDSEEEVSGLVCAIDGARKSEEELRKQKDEVKQWTARLSAAQETFQKLNVPLDYSDQKRLSLFKTAFGLDFKITEDRAISFVFSNLSSDTPSTKCSVTLDIVSVADSEQWTVVAVEPEAVTGVTELVQQLNHTKQLGQFCKQVRQIFKDYLSSTQQNI